MAINGVELSWSALLSPLYILEIFLFALGLAFILSTIYVRLRDMNYIWEIIMQALFYASAIIYPLAMVMERSDAIAKLMLLNPVAQAVQDIRHVLISPHNPTLYTLTDNLWLSLAPIGLVVIVAVLGMRLFKKRSPYFAEEV
jgi:ABC-2 type transport system permease protein